MLETAMLKVFATDTLWRIINDTIQIFGGKAYFTDEPYERMMRDARINMIGEGANDVLRAFIALVGMRDVGLELQAVLQGFRNPLKNLGRLSGFVGRRVEGDVSLARGSRPQAELESDAAQLGKATARFASHVERLLRKHREAIVDREYQLGRIGDSAIELYVCACVLRWLDARLAVMATMGMLKCSSDLLAGRYYLAHRRAADRRQSGRPVGQRRRTGHRYGGRGAGRTVAMTRPQDGSLCRRGASGSQTVRRAIPTPVLANYSA